MTARCPTLQARLRTKRSKYKNVHTEYRGRMYHNAREAQRAAELDLRQAAGDVLDWDPQVRQPLVVNGVKIGNYIADFSVTYSNGSEQLVDVKGAPPTQVFKLKAILVAALYPDCAIKVIQ